MKFWMFLAFLFAVASFGWWVKAVEHMTERNPIYGPKIVNREKCVREYPEIFTADTYLMDGSIQRELPANIPVDSKTPTSVVPNVRNKPAGAPVPDASGTGTTTGTRQKSAPADRKTNDGTLAMMDRKQLSGPSSSWEQDDGTVSSDTATSNPLFQQVYAYNPEFQTSFPVSGPPQPFLTDFSKMHS
jgi:hypothetical protein